ncbi:hypothetical protein BKA56DRAFT_584120, partial [Ilyonectria sp. MPI-CAGE-AT-0026]
SILGFPRPYTSYTNIHRVDTGAAYWDCAKTGHTCRPVPAAAYAAVRAFWDLNRQFSGQLRACSSGAAPPAAPVPAPALDLFGEILEKSLEERKLWVQLIQQAEDNKKKDEDN